MNQLQKRLLSDSTGLLLAMLLSSIAGFGAPSAVFFAAVVLVSAVLAWRDRQNSSVSLSSRITSRVEAALLAAVVAWFTRFDFAAISATTGIWLLHALLPDRIRELAWVPAFLSLISRCYKQVRSRLLRLHASVFDCVAFTIVAAVFVLISKRIWPDSPAPLAFWVTAALFGLIPTLAARMRFLTGNNPRGDVIRMAALMALAFFLLKPFAQRCLHGTSDAAWYGTMMQDMILQVRAGIFPVFGGQTEFQYSGVLYPIRIAPAFHYLGALTDIATGQQLDGISVQNLLIVFWGMLAAVTAYLSFGVLLRENRFLAALAALLFISCPGTLAIAYFTDLYMSWTTVPFVPIVFAATALTFEKVTLRRTLVLGASLGALWWGHTPIALWCTILASAFQVYRLVAIRRSLLADWKPLAGGAVSFALAASFPIAAAVLYPAEPGAPVASFQRAEAGSIVRFLKEAWPGNLLPIENGGRSLSGFQLGYALWALLAIAVCLAWKNRDRVSTAFAAVALALAVWLTPWPWVSEAMWSLVPSFVRNTTGNWVMNRLYVIFAAVILVAIASIASRLWARADTVRRSYVIIGILTLVGWSVAEGRKFGSFSEENQRLPDEALRTLEPENIVITRFAYLVFPQVPGTFTHGTIDPELEHRFLSDADEVLWTNESRVVDAVKKGDPGTAMHDLGRFSPTESEDRWVVKKLLEIPYGTRRLLQVDFAGLGQNEGVLQLKGKHLFREYGLPIYGGPLSFGSTPGAKNTVSLWTSQPGGEKAEIIFFKRGNTTDADVSRLSVRDLVFTDAQLPIRVKSWLPYQVEVDSPEAGWVETPRAFQAHWKRSDGGPLKKTKEGLLAFRHDGGKHTYEISYRVPGGFTVFFWISAGMLLAGLVIVPASRIRFSV